MTADIPRQLFHDKLKDIVPCAPRWIYLLVDESLPVPLMTLRCELTYSTIGTPEIDYTDRGKLLGALDKMLVDTLLTETQSCSGDGFTIWWSAPQFRPVMNDREKLVRVVDVEILAFETPKQVS